MEFYKTALGLDPRTVSPETFPLPTLGPTLKQACRDIYEGRGFFILRGFDEIDTLTPEDVSVVYLGISGYIAGRRGKQDQKGSMMSKFQDPFPAFVWIVWRWQCVVVASSSRRDKNAVMAAELGHA